MMDIRIKTIHYIKRKSLNYFWINIKRNIYS